MNWRLKRLYNDYTEVSQAFAEHPYIAIKKAVGDPPEKYQIEYKIKGVEQKDNKLVEKDHHLVEIVLTLDYPQVNPQCLMLTPVFHPNIAPHVICIADHWAASESLSEIIVRIGEMICYQNYNIKSPRNGDAAKWAVENVHRFPLDTVDLTFKKLPEETIINQTNGKEPKMVIEQQEKKLGDYKRSDTKNVI